MKRRALFLAALALLIVIGAGAAFAYWTTHGTGTGAGHTATLVAPTSVTATAASKLVPGGSADLSVTLTNSNSYSINIVGISQAAGTIGVTPSCTTPAVSVPTQTLSTPVVVAAGTHTVTIPSSLVMGVGSTNDCQNATFTNIPITLAITTP
jgi:hypothetical protein